MHDVGCEDQVEALLGEALCDRILFKVEHLQAHERMFRAEAFAGALDEGAADVGEGVLGSALAQPWQHVRRGAAGAGADLQDAQRACCTAAFHSRRDKLRHEAVEEPRRRRITVEALGGVGRPGREQQLQRVAIAVQRGGQFAAGAFGEFLFGGDRRGHGGARQGPRFAERTSDHPRLPIAREPALFGEDREQALEQLPMALDDAELCGQRDAVEALASRGRPAQAHDRLCDESSAQRVELRQRRVVGRDAGRPVQRHDAFARSAGQFAEHERARGLRRRCIAPDDLVDQVVDRALAEAQQRRRVDALESQVEQLRDGCAVGIEHVQVGAARAALLCRLGDDVRPAVPGRARHEPVAADRQRQVERVVGLARKRDSQQLQATVELHRVEVIGATFGFELGVQRHFADGLARTAPDAVQRLEGRPEVEPALRQAGVEGHAVDGLGAGGARCRECQRRGRCGVGLRQTGGDMGGPGLRVVGFVGKTGQAHERGAVDGRVDDRLHAAACAGLVAEQHRFLHRHVFDAAGGDTVPVRSGGEQHVEVGGRGQHDLPVHAVLCHPARRINRDMTVVDALHAGRAQPHAEQRMRTASSARRGTGSRAEPATLALERVGGPRDRHARLAVVHGAPIDLGAF